MSGRKKTFEIVLTIFSLVVLLSGCPGAGPNDSGSTPPSATSATVALTVKVRAARGAPDDFGLVPGDMIAGAEVEVAIPDSSGGASYAATTDESGSVVLMVQGGSYYISAKKDTHDPYCWWYAGEDVEVADKPVTVKLYDLWVLCE